MANLEILAMKWSSAVIVGPFIVIHLGPAALIKSIIPKYFSFTLFAFTQVLIDCETLYYVLRGLYPPHGWLHTYIGINLAIVLALLIGRPVCRGFLRMVRLPSDISMKCAIVTLIIAAWGHMLTDSIIHADLKPFSPLYENNSMFGIISLSALHIGCAVSGLAGIMILIITRAVKKI